MGFPGILIFIFNIIRIYLLVLKRKLASKSEKNVKGEIVLITGAAHGIGRQTAIEFAKLGAIVVLSDINEKGLNETKELVEERGGTARAYICDVASRFEVKELGQKIRNDIGDVTILINNAGIINNGHILKSSDDSIEKIFQVNILAHFWTIREFLPSMKKNNHGHLVSLASIAGLGSAPFMVDYCSTKHAAVGLTKGLREELRLQGHDGVKVTCMCPYFVNTGFVTNIKSDLVPVLTTRQVVDELMKAVLLEKHLVVLPKSLQPWSFTPYELECFLFDLNNPTCDQMNSPTCDQMN